MKKLGTAIFLSIALMLFSSCTLTVTANEEETTEKTGYITVAESWSGSSTFYANDVHISGGNVTWENGITVIVTGILHVDNNGSLNIEEGVTVKFNKDAYIEVANSGSGTLQALGTSTKPVIFTKNDGVSVWGFNDGSVTYSGGIWFNEASTTLCRLHNCIVEYAASGVTLQNCKVAISSSVFRNNKHIGINFEDDEAKPDTSVYRFTDNTFNGNGSYPIRISPQSAGYICSGNTLTGNSKDMIYLEKSGYIEDGIVTWRNHGVPYLVYDDVKVRDNGSLIIQPGISIKMNAQAYFDIANTGSASIIANGTAADSIRFTAYTPGAKWGFNPTSSTYSGGLFFNTGSTAFCSISYAVIEDAVTGIYLETAINITNSRISNSRYYGIIVTEAAYLPSGIRYSGNGTNGTDSTLVK